MEHGSFDDQIFGDFGSGPLSPLGASKPLLPTATTTITHGTLHPVMLGSVVHELCSQQQQQQQQRLPDCNTILPNGGGAGSPSYAQNFGNKLGCFSPSQKYEYITTPQKLVEQQQQQQSHHQQQQQQYAVTPPPPHSHHNGMLHHKSQQQQQQQLVGIMGDYHTLNGKLEYSPKDQYEPQQQHVQLQQHQQHMYGGSPHHSHAAHVGHALTHEDANANGNGMMEPAPLLLSNGNSKKKPDEMCAQLENSSSAATNGIVNGNAVGNSNGGNANNNNNGSNGSNNPSTPTNVGAGTAATATAGGAGGAANAAKKDNNNKKKGDPNGIKKKKTR